MEGLYKKHDQYMQVTPMEMVRDAMDDFNWDARLIAVVGARGVGKSTLIRQYIKKNYAAYDRSALYCSLDSVYFTTHSLVDLAERFVMNGGTRLVLDEIHKYPHWSREVKEIYDLYPQLRIVISGSSLLQILNAESDLSRRCLRYTLRGLSFREFLRFYKGIDIARRDLRGLLSAPADLCAEVNEKCRPVKFFKEYLQYGYYPFYLEGSEDYYTRIEQVVDFVVSVELPLLRNVNPANVRKVKQLLGVVASSTPFELDASKLARAIGVGRDTVVEYIGHLADAGLLNTLYSESRSIGRLSRPDKIYLENANLLHALSFSEVLVGTARETFVLSQLRDTHEVEYSKAAGDFRVDGRYTFEVGGRDKGFSQIASIDNSYVLADDIETPLHRKLPLWIIGFLY